MLRQQLKLLEPGPDALLRGALLHIVQQHELHAEREQKEQAQVPEQGGQEEEEQGQAEQQQADGGGTGAFQPLDEILAPLALMQSDVELGLKGRLAMAMVGSPPAGTTGVLQERMERVGRALRTACCEKAKQLAAFPQHSAMMVTEILLAADECIQEML